MHILLTSSLWMSGPVAHAGEPPAPPPPVPALTRSYTLQPAASVLYVLVYNDPTRFTPVTGHDHAITATDFTGSVTWNVDDASVCVVDIRVPISALAVDPDSMRAKAGLPAEGAITDSQKETVIQNMKSKKNLQSPPSTDITFKATQCDGTTGAVRVTGTMQIAGISKEITVTMNVTAEGNTFRARGTYGFLHEDYGMSPFTYGPLTPRNRDDLKMVIDLTGRAT